MKMDRLLPVFISISLISISWGCQSEKSADLKLPFYNTAEFTPEWINEGDPGYSEIHTIGSFNFLNQNGDKITNQDLEGKIYVADFFFTLCPGICPKMTSNMAKLQKEFISDDDVMLLSHSVMPWADSITVLKEYAEARDINSNKWHLLTGSQESIYSLARQSYFAEKEIGLDKETDEFLHTENFILVDGKGRIRGVYNGTLSLEVSRLITDIKNLKKFG